MHYNFVKAINRRYLEELKNKVHEMSDVYKAVNIMQNTEWVINKPIYEVIKTCFENDFGLGKLPIHWEALDLPIKPKFETTKDEVFIQWKRRAAKIWTERAKRKSKWIQVKQILAEAEMLLDKGGFFFPYQLDFRGRVYPKPSMLSPQSADYSRALLKFKFGKRIGDNFDTFAIAGANLYGEVDKEELPKRVKWVQDNAEKIVNCADKPLEYSWWASADKPYCFLAWCIEFKEYNKTYFDDGFITTLPIQADCSNSGLQHYSALVLDKFGGEATNLVPLNKPSDIYNLVAEKVVDKLKKEKNSIAKTWLEYGVDRKICKKPVMCLPYSLTRYSCRKYIEDHIVEQFRDRGVQHKWGDDLFEPTQYLTPIVWEAINEVVVGARKIMNFLKTISRLVASENLPVCWHTPLGFPVQMMCYKKKSRRVKTKMGDSIVKLSVATDTNVIDKRKTGQSVCANYIHSLDAACLMLAVVKAKEAGVDNYSLIHDSFGCCCPDTKTMANAIRDAFCEIYKQDVLKNFADEMYEMLSEKNQKKFPTIPEKGTLDLDLVRKSIFFCI